MQKSFFQKTKLYDLEYEVNGETYRGLYSFILISNANRIAGINNFHKDVKLDDNMIEVQTVDTSNNKYVGYKFSHTTPAQIPTEIETDSVIEVHYIKDEEQTKELSYCQTL